MLGLAMHLPHGWSHPAVTIICETMKQIDDLRQARDDKAAFRLVQAVAR